MTSEEKLLSAGLRDAQWSQLLVDGFWCVVEVGVWWWTGYWIVGVCGVVMLLITALHIYVLGVQSDTYKQVLGMYKLTHGGLHLEQQESEEGLTDAERKALVDAKELIYWSIMEILSTKTWWTKCLTNKKSA